jgi:transcription initiation factor TFIIH subunit 3
MLYASSDAVEHATPITVDANSYPPFKLLDACLVEAIVAELDKLDTDLDSQGPALVGALTKALCRMSIQPLVGLHGEGLIMRRCQPCFILFSISYDDRGAALPRRPNAVVRCYRPPHPYPLGVA